MASIADRYLAYLASPDVSDIDKLHLAMHLRFIESGWEPEQRREVLRFLAKARKWEGGGSFSHYVMNVSRDFAKMLGDEDIPFVLENGASWPNAALGVLYKLPKELDDETRAILKRTDAKLDEEQSQAVRRLKIGIVAVLARSGDPDSIEYLYEIWNKDPERRQAVALGLSTAPNQESWPYMVRSMPVLEGPAAREVIKKLGKIALRPEEGEHYRHVILQAMQLKEKGAADAVALLEHWTGERLAEDEGWEKQLDAWQEWFAKEYPDLPTATLPVIDEDAKWNVAELHAYLNGEGLEEGDATRGMDAFVKADCAKCHRFGGKGESMGPDLTSITKRFTKKEILESIIHPSHVISDQYAAKMIITSDGKQMVGIVAPGAAGEFIVLKSNGDKVVVSEAEVDEIAPSKTSAMPTGLLDSLREKEIADLFAYLYHRSPTSLVRKPTSDSSTK